MNVDGLIGLVNRVIAWADRLQREHGVLGLPYAAVKKSAMMRAAGALANGALTVVATALPGPPCNAPPRCSGRRPHL
jgi:hypothetical protein